MAQFSPISASDHSSYLWIVVILCMIYVTFAVALRVYLKWNVFGTCDVVFLFAMVCIVALFANMK
jgi:hypothetical protein